MKKIFFKVSTEQSGLMEELLIIVTEADLYCPLTERLMIKPVILSDGETYEQEVIVKRQAEAKERREEFRSPLYNTNLSSHDLHNYELIYRRNLHTEHLISLFNQSPDGAIIEASSDDFIDPIQATILVNAYINVDNRALNGENFGQLQQSPFTRATLQKNFPYNLLSNIVKKSLENFFQQFAQKAPYHELMAKYNPLHCLILFIKMQWGDYLKLFLSIPEHQELLRATPQLLGSTTGLTALQIIEADFPQLLEQSHYLQILSFAIAKKVLNLVEHIFTHKKVASYPDMENNLYPLQLAVSTGHLAITRLVAAYYADYLNIGNKELLTPLHVACMQDNVEIVAHLLQQGASVTALSNHDALPLFYAILNGYTDIVDELLKPQVIHQYQLVLPGLKKNLICCSLTNRLDYITMLMRIPQTLDLLANNIEILAANQGLTVLKWFVTTYPQYLSQNAYMRLLNKAIKNKTLSVVEYLLQSNNIDKSLANIQLTYPIHNAVLSYEPAICDLVVKYFALYLEVKNHNQDTALCLAVSLNNKVIVKLLLDHGAAITHEYNEHNPLHAAISNNSLFCLNILLAHPVSFNLAPEYLQAPLTFARQLDNNSIIAVLEEKIEQSTFINRLLQLSRS